MDLNLFTKNGLKYFHFLNATQFLGALNDNLYKLLIVFMLIQVQGNENANTILSIAGAVFVIPFLLFSSSAGILADRLSKRSILVSMKVVEILAMVLGTIAIYFHSEWGVYSLLFLMATQSALFGPSKYGIIPELVESRKISKANGLLTSFTFLAIILGTVLGPFLSKSTDKNFFLASLACVLIAILGLITSLGIPKTSPRGYTKRITPLFLKEIYHSLVVSSKQKHLLPSIWGSAFFLFIGGFTQLNIIPFAIQSLGLEAEGGGYLFSVTAIGIAIGAVIAGKILKEQTEPALSCLSGFAIGVTYLLLMIFSHSLFMTVILLALLGVFGGLFLIPFDSFIQINSPDQKRGQTIAAANFLSFCGVLVAAGFLYLIGDVLHLSASAGFFLMGILTLLFTLAITGKMGSLFFPYIAHHFLLFRKKLIKTTPPDPENILVIHSESFKDVFTLFALLPEMTVFVPGRRGKVFPWFNFLFDSFRLIQPLAKLPLTVELLFNLVKNTQKKGAHACLFLPKKLRREEISRTYKEVFEKFSSHVYFVEIKTHTPLGKQREVEISFEKV